MSRFSFRRKLKNTREKKLNARLCLTIGTLDLSEISVVTEISEISVNLPFKLL